MDDNPYAPPHNVSATASGWYTTNLFALNTAELRALVPQRILFLLFVCVRPLGRLGLIPSSSFTAHSPGQFVPIDESELSPEVLEKIRPIATEAEALGYRFVSFVAVPYLGNLRIYTGSWLEAAGTIVMRIDYACLWNSLERKEQLACWFISHFPDGRTLATTGKTKDFETPPQFEVEYLPGQEMTAILQRHREKIDARDDKPISIRDDVQLDELLRQLDLEEAKFHVDRGFFIEATPSQLEKLQRDTAGNVDPVQVQLSRLQLVVLLVFFASVLILWFGHPSSWWRELAGPPAISSAIMLIGLMLFRYLLHRRKV